jgi:hypothetical protein
LFVSSTPELIDASVDHVRGTPERNWREHYGDRTPGIAPGLVGGMVHC